MVPISVGIVPLKKFWARSREVIRHSFPNSVGIVPESVVLAIALQFVSLERDRIVHIDNV